ncbi:MAG: ABC transporter permease [Nanoarchaeota archaeon]|nr:ABC transporter permease [Nanoarchaeota archaeon]
MNLSYFSLAFNNLRRRKLRSWLTMIGIFIGIAAVVALISLGQGLQGYINQQFEQLGGDKIIIQSKTIGPPGSNTNPNLILTSKDLEVIRNVRGVEQAEGILMKTGPVTFKDQTEIVFIIGGNEDYLDLFGDVDALKVIEGRQLKDEDKSKIVVGNNHVFGDLWDKKVEIGNSLEIESENFKVIGVVKKQGNPFDDNSVWMQKETMAELLNVEDEESQIVVKVATGFNPEEVSEDIERKLRNFRDEKEGQETFNVQTAGQLLETFSNIFSVVQAVLVGIAAISLLVGGIGIMNTMYTSVLERTKEIGTMKAIGAKNSDILFIFLIESGLLGLVGGAIGVAIGIGLGKTAEYIATNALGTPLLQAIFPWYLIVGALSFSFLIGSLSGILPAIQASKMKPADALRYE